MAQSGGGLIVKSQQGRGTTAELWLPVAAVSEEPVLQAAVEPEAAVTKLLTVLAVDDDSLVLMNTIMMLEDLGHGALEASSCSKALELLEIGPLPGIVITDHAMPHMSGAELAGKIAELYPDLKVILATGYAELPDGIEVSIPRLSKPFTQKQLNAALSID